jgi:hypothetical protein
VSVLVETQALPWQSSFDPGPTAREAGALTRFRRRVEGNRPAGEPLFFGRSFDSGLHVGQAGALTQLRRSWEATELQLPPLPRLTGPQLSTLLSVALVGCAVARPWGTFEAPAGTAADPLASLPPAVASPSRLAQQNAVARAIETRGELPIASIQAKLVGGAAVLPEGAPRALEQVVAAANRINGMPYSYGGGHGSFESSGYDCSGAVSYALHGGGMLDSPLASGSFTGWGQPGEGKAITVYANAGHAYAVIAGLRWDTSGTSGSGPSWHQDMRSPAGYVARHPSGY